MSEHQIPITRDEAEAIVDMFLALPKAERPSHAYYLVEKLCDVFKMKPMEEKDEGRPEAIGTEQRCIRCGALNPLYVTMRGEPICGYVDCTSRPALPPSFFDPADLSLRKRIRDRLPVVPPDIDRSAHPPRLRGEEGEETKV